jgi:hypothetical protein
MKIMNLKFKFFNETQNEIHDENYYKINKIICEKFNNMNGNDLIKFTLNYVFDLTFFENNKFNWDDHLSVDKPFDCDVYYRGINIGSINLCNLKHISPNNDDINFFNVTYNKNIKHSPYLDEYDPFDKYYLVSQFKNNSCSYKFELSHDHPHCKLEGCLACNHTSYNIPFSWAFNGIVKENNSLSYLLITNADDDDVYPNRGKFQGYSIKNANFEDAVKSLLLFHLLVNNLIGNHDESCFKNYSYFRDVINLDALWNIFNFCFK